ncbi:MAG TPA: sigma-70 family RNA polymerase sigma factor [Solirubrobacterales bacterium]|nr:sigma-70 family RNA polymerase sigma factor [Solirubrobacterales bacterium]
MQGELAAETNEAARKRAAVELIASHGSTLERVARRYSLCAEDAEDAYQRGLEILLTKAPSDRARDLLAWTKTVIKHEALAVRAGRERLLGRAPTGRGATVGGDREYDWVARVPASGPGPEERVERREEIARSREALRALKPAELRALTLLAEGYSYAEIGEITGFSHTKINRSLAEGRERFRRLLLRSEDGSRCAEMRPLLSTFCDGETGVAETTHVREHLRACGHCRAVVRAYRAAPARVAALAPLLGAPPLAGASEGTASATAFGGEAVGTGAGAKSVAGAAAGGMAKGAGGTVVAKLAAACAATVGATACVAAGVLPSPAELALQRPTTPSIERIAPVVLGPPGEQSAAKRRERADDERERRRTADRSGRRQRREPVEASTSETEATAAAAPAPAPEPVQTPEPAAAAEPAPAPEAAPAPIPPPAPESPAPSGGGAAGEFGP